MTKRFIGAFLLLFVFIFGYEFLVHAVLLQNMYQSTATVWRSYHQMMAYVPFNTLIQFLMAFWFVFIFSRLFRNGGWKNGILFGLYIGVLCGVQAAGAYYYLPIPSILAIYWFVAHVIEGVIGGYLIGLVYRR